MKAKTTYHIIKDKSFILDITINHENNTITIEEDVHRQPLPSNVRATMIRLIESLNKVNTVSLKGNLNAQVVVDFVVESIKTVMNGEVTVIQKD